MDSDESEMKAVADELKQYQAWRMAQKSINKVELKTEKIDNVVKQVKEKKPRTEAQLMATAKMRDALKTRHTGIENKKSEHSEKYQKKMEETQDKADKLKEAFPDLKVVVKSAVGRPKGVKNPPQDPTPYISDTEDEPKPITVKTKKPLVGKTIASVNQDLMSAYLNRLNNF